MISINYNIHKFAGYIIFPIRVIFSTCLTLVTFGSLTILDHIGFKKMGDNLVLRYTYNIIKLFGISIHIKGLENITDKPCIIVGNHINIYDHFVMTYIQNKLPAFISSDKFNIFPISYLITYFRNIHCNPEKKGNVVEKIRERIKEGGQITIYPDGCNIIPDKKLIAPFRNGAFVPKEPILPIVIRYVSSSNENMNWCTNTISNSPFSILTSYLLDGDINVYVKVLPLQHYKDSYKSHEDYRDYIYELMTTELSKLPEQKPTLIVGRPSTEITMNYLIYLLYLSLFTYCIGNISFCCMYLFHFISSYFCHFYPTKNTQLLDMLIVSYNITRNTFISIQNNYDLYIRIFIFLFLLSRYPIYLQYKNEIPFPEMRHIKNTWIPSYTLCLYPLLLNTLELYNFI